jgi:hypothetical protein
MDWESFERVVAQVLSSMGFVAELTQTTSDGGIDVIARRDEPLLRGKYVVQCKNWSTPVGVAVIRDLYGTMTHERANKGILITTSSFTRGAIEFAEDKPLELIDGEQWDALVKRTGATPLSETVTISRAQIADGVIAVFDDLARWARKSMQELDYVHDKDPTITTDYSAPTGQHRNDYREYALKSISSFRQAIAETFQFAERLKQSINRWSDLKERGYKSELREDLTQLKQYRRFSDGYQESFGKSFDEYYSLKKTRPHPAFTHCHANALEGMYYGLSAALSLFISTPAKHYEGKTVYMTVEAPQELLDHYIEQYHSLRDAALKGLQSSSWLDRLLGRG